MIWLALALVLNKLIAFNLVAQILGFLFAEANFKEDIFWRQGDGWGNMSMSASLAIAAVMEQGEPPFHKMNVARFCDH